MKRTSLFHTKAPSDEAVGGEMSEDPDGHVGGKMRKISDGQVDHKMSIKSDGHVDVEMLELSDGQFDDGQMGEISDGQFDDGQMDGIQVGNSYNTNELNVSGEIKNVGQNQTNDQIAVSNEYNKDPTEAKYLRRDVGQVPRSSYKRTGPYTVGSSRDIRVRLQSDKKTCDIWDMCLLSDGRILMLEDNNYKLKLIDSDLNIVHYCDVPYTHSSIPKCFSMINDTEAVMAMMDNHIQFVSVEDKLELGKKIQMVYGCHGLVCSNGELYVSDAVTNIHVYTVDGQKLRTITSDLINVQGYSEWLTVSNDGSRIYISSILYGIVCRDRLSGEAIWKVKDTDDNYYSGICVDRYNNVFVCRYGKNDVVQFSPDGQLIGVVVNESEGVCAPRSVKCIDEGKGRLIVGMDDSDAVKVFDLKQL